MSRSARDTGVDDLPDRKLNTRAAAQYLDVHPVTLRKWRQETGKGPRWHVFEGRIRYRLDELREFSEGRA